MELAGVKPRPIPASTTRFWQKIGLIAEISSVCRQQKPDEPSYQEVLELIQGIIPFDAATLYLSWPGSPGLKPQAQLSELVPLPGPLMFGSEPGSESASPTLRKPIMWPGDPDGDFGAPDGYVMRLVVPLLIDAEIIGVLNLGSYVDGVLAERHLQLMMIIADQLAISVERLNRMAEIQAQNEALRHAHRQLIAGQQRVVAAEKLAVVMEMAAVVNHEINNPLAVIVGQIQCLLREQPDLGGRAAKRLHQVEQAALRIGEVNRRLLKLEATEVGDANPVPVGTIDKLTKDSQK